MAEARGIRAGAAYVEMFLKDNRLTQGLATAQAKLKAFSAGLTRLGSRVGVVGALSLSPIIPALETLNEQSKLSSVAEAFGLTAEEASRLFGIMRSGGSDLRDATEGLVTFNQRVEDALTGTGEEAKKLFQGLGVSAREFAGLNSADRFYRLIDALRALPDPAKRVQLLLKAVGEDTGKNLIPVLSMTEAEMQTLGDAFEQNAADLQQARESGRAYTLAIAQISRAWREVVAAIAPAIRELADWVTQAVKLVVTWIRENREVVKTAALVAAGILGVGLALVGLGVTVGLASSALGGLLGLFGALGTAIGMVGSLLGALLTPIGLVAAALVGLGYLFVTETESGRQMISDLKAGFLSFADTARTAWRGIVDAIQAGDLGLAAKIALAAVNLEWAKAVLWWMNKWNAFKGFFLDGWHDLVAGIKLIWWDFIGWIAKAIGGLTDILADVVDFFGLGSLARGIRDEFKDLTPENINLGRDAIKKEVLQDRGKRQREADAARKADTAGAMDDVRKAADALQDAVNQAARKRAEMGEKAMPRMKKPPVSPGEIEDLRAKVDVLGTFNAMGVRGLGGETTSARTLKAVEEINQNLKKVLLEAQNGGLVFA